MYKKLFNKAAHFRGLGIKDFQLFSSYFSQILTSIVAAAIWKIGEAILASPAFTWSAETIINLLRDMSHLAAVFFVFFIIIVNPLIWARKNYKIAALAQNAGLHFYLPNSGNNDTNKIEEAIVNSLSTERDIKILGATGFNTFGKRDSFLGDLVRKCTGQIIVVLLDPAENNLAIGERARQLRMDVEDYRKEIVHSVTELKQLHLQGKAVSLYFYHHCPQWKLYLTNDHVWVQRYALGAHVAGTQIFGFERKPDSENFFDYFCDLFNRIVKRLEEKGYKVDLENWLPAEDKH